MIALFIHLPLLIALSFLLWKRSAGMPLRRVFVPALLVKGLASVVIGLLYTYYFPYEGDTFLFFSDSKVLSNLARQAPAHYVKVLLLTDFTGIERLRPEVVMSYEPRTLFLEKILSVVNLATFDNYWLAGLYFSLFSFWGMWLLANTLARLFPASQWAAALAVLFFPSVVFFSSGVMKETLVIGALGIVSTVLLTYRFAQTELNKQFKRSNIAQKVLVFCVMLLVIWKLKYYYFVVFVACAIAYSSTRWLAKRWRMQTRGQLATMLLLFTVMMGIGSQAHSNLRPSRFMQVLVYNHNLIYSISQPNSRIEYDHLETTGSSLLKNVPKALFSGLYRPLEWTWLQGELSNPWQLYFGIENLLLLAMTLLLLYRWIRGKLFLPPSVDLLLPATVVLYIVLLATLLALSTPNFGTLSRYKVAFMPFMLYLLASGTEMDTWMNRLASRVRRGE